MSKDYMDMLQILDNEIVEIANSGQLEDYIKENFSKWAVNYNGGNTYVYICDEEMKNADEETFKAYKFLTDKNNVELEGIPIEDVMELSAICFMRLSEAHLEKARFEKNEDGKIMYWGFSDTMTEFVECFVK